ncbi:HLA class II histocompatibility antigen, DQ beta 1 chain-like [Trichosurus vulpecula]|uniref:HLA class II histocompatibility antigen, DQ beta 1 chain-like n=1 Tax=Trichosurus vulpecula TaxID=9337 RepID=UPI00186AECDD|nr:HLA class II histocompatibility antigen, DQ beta 1 chain-like [Trichosurus vulpecula]
MDSWAHFLLVEPKVIVYPSKIAPLGHHNLLVCSVNGFYPGDIEVRWFLNGQEETSGIVSTGLISNGDWTYQILVMLEITPKHGDVYTCQVKLSSLQRHAILDWKAQSESAQSKMLTGVRGLVLGLIFFGVGLIVHKRSQKGLCYNMGGLNHQFVLVSANSLGCVKACLGSWCWAVFPGVFKVSKGGIRALTWSSQLPEVQEAPTDSCPKLRVLVITTAAGDSAQGLLMPQNVQV